MHIKGSGVPTASMWNEYVYICIYVTMHICIYVYVYVYVYMYMYICICILYTCIPGKPFAAKKSSSGKECF